MIFEKLKKRAVLAVVAATFSATGAQAASGDVALGLKASTLGVGLELTVGVGEKVNLRFGGNYFKLSKNLEEGGNDYDFDLKMQNYTALVDWHALGGNFRISGGAVFDKNKLDGLARASNTYDLGGATFTSAEVGALRGLIDFRSVSPYLGIGWGNAFSGNGNLHFTFDIGVIFTGTPRVNLTSTGGTLSDNETLLDALNDERQDVIDDIDFFKYYPVVSLGLVYRF